MNKVIDLFAGCGGFSLGFEKSGFSILKAIEFNETIAETYSKNHLKTKLIIDDIKNIDNSNFFSEGEANIIIGGPPCQGFSMAGARIRNDFINDPRNYLFKHYLNIVRIVLPDIFLFENVKGILTLENGEVFKQIISSFENSELFKGNKYNLHTKVLNAKDFGIPQNRERVIILGIKNKQVNFDELIEQTKTKIKNDNKYFFEDVNIWDAISDLESLPEIGKVEKLAPITNYQLYLSNGEKFVYNHIKTKHDNVAIDRMKQISPGQNFTSLNENIKSIHSGSYGRLSKKDIAQTITTRFDTPSGGRFIHPIHNRTLTPREAARIQSFPDNFIFYGTKSSISTQIGNAVPPKLSFFLAELVKEILHE